MLTVSIQASEKLGPSRNGRMERNFPELWVSSKGSPKFSEILSGTFPVPWDF